ncbi:hypothetical protein [Aquihabitans sp. McL0605]|uniref:hypothetical protein n=1 Tax=Aquihabitans sp. McL0605 TaxID=3415671 RepID=UPI003CF99AA3
MELPDTPMPLHRHPNFHRMVGSSRQALGWLTADRHVEAAGAAEHFLLERPSPDVVAQMEHDILLRYDEARPSAAKRPSTY